MTIRGPRLDPANLHFSIFIFQLAIPLESYFLVPRRITRFCCLRDWSHPMRMHRCMSERIDLIAILRMGKVQQLVLQVVEERRALEKVDLARVHPDLRSLRAGFL